MKHVSKFNGNVGCGEVNSSAGVGTQRACPRLGLDEFSRVTRGVLGEGGPAVSPCRATLCWSCPGRWWRQVPGASMGQECCRGAAQAGAGSRSQGWQQGSVLPDTGVRVTGEPCMADCCARLEKTA